MYLAHSDGLFRGFVILADCWFLLGGEGQWRLKSSINSSLSLPECCTHVVCVSDCSNDCSARLSCSFLLLLWFIIYKALPDAEEWLRNNPIVAMGSMLINAPGKALKGTVYTAHTIAAKSIRGVGGFFNTTGVSGVVTSAMTS